MLQRAQALLQSDARGDQGGIVALGPTQGLIQIER